MKTCNAIVNRLEANIRGSSLTIERSPGGTIVTFRGDSTTVRDSLDIRDLGTNVAIFHADPEDEADFDALANEVAALVRLVANIV